MNLVELGNSIAAAPRVVGSTLSLVSSGQCSIVVATNSSSHVGGWNPPLEVFLSLWKGEVIWRGDYTTYNVEFVAAEEEWTWSNGKSVMLLCGEMLMRLSIWLAQGNTALRLQQNPIFYVHLSLPISNTFLSHRNICPRKKSFTEMYYSTYLFLKQ